ncbi:uncharacterized protein LOC113213573 [Frankliniella occidentalis]|uniref:Uncharacterized protein LOC113213573 n=1 Tax=Frankliniella occidentalis TaxID=133901 RepID=A0A9C6XR86_FRAOC|nr:uncharacterized protein LOC113213573 [Frankliniella occidentalis]
MDRCTRLAMVRSFGGLRPVTVCSSEFVPMRRPRFFGGNLSSLTLGGRQKQSTSLILQDFLEPGRTALVKKLQTITTNPASQRCADGRRPVRQANGKESYLRLTELEVLFGYSRSWTDTGDLSLSARRQLIGRSFCVPVIASLLEELQILYKYYRWQCPSSRPVPKAATSRQLGAVVEVEKETGDPAWNGRWQRQRHRRGQRSNESAHTSRLRRMPRRTGVENLLYLC